MERGKQLEKDFKEEKSHKDYEEQFGMSYESTKKTKEYDYSGQSIFEPIYEALLLWCITWNAIMEVARRWT